MRLGLAILLLALAAGGAQAQTAPGPDAQPPAYDPIGDAIAAALPPDQTTDQEPDAEPDTPAAVSAAPVVTAPPRPLVIAPRRAPTLDRPVMIDETGKSPDGPPSQTDLGYEMRIRGSAASAQGLQGPLDGGWTVRTDAGAAVLSLQLVDRGQGYGQLEGAWRSLDAPMSRVGLIDSLDRQPAVLTIRITRAPGKPTLVLSLTPASDGGWRGDLMDERGVRPVVMTRN
ncbi:MAG: hypothetical protein WC068_02865 [Caulobacter sp.]